MIPRTTKKKKNCHEDLVLLLLERGKSRSYSAAAGSGRRLALLPRHGALLRPSRARSDLERRFTPRSRSSAPAPALPERSCQELLPLTARSLFSGGPDFAGAVRELPFIAASRSRLQAPMPAPSSPRSTLAVPGAAAEAAAAWGQCWLPAPPAPRPAFAPRSQSRPR